MAGNNVHHFDDTNFEAEVLGHTGTPVVVDFHATWCGPCKVLAPIVDRFADEFEGKVKVGKIDTDQAPKTAAKYGVTSIPTVMVFENGEKKASRMGLLKPKELAALAGL